MKIGETRPQPVVQRVKSKNAVGKASAVDSTAEAGAVRSIDDTAEIMGIPEQELTPKVRSAIVGLMEEVGNLRGEIARATKRLAELEKLADTDSLAPVANRRAFVRELSRIQSYAERYGASASLVYFDINGFKEINDNYGHSAGDQAILHIVDILIGSIRESDMVGRLGGDEFGVILAQVDADAVHEKAEQLVGAIRSRPFLWDDHEIHLDAAYGTHTFQAGVDAAGALAAADQAMYENKRKAKQQAAASVGVAGGVAAPANATAKKAPAAAPEAPKKAAPEVPKKAAPVNNLSSRKAPPLLGGRRR